MATKTPRSTRLAREERQALQRLREYLAQPAGLILSTPVGAFSDLGALGWSADERHQPSFSIVKCGLNNVGYYFPPVNPTLLALSL